MLCPCQISPVVYFELPFLTYTGAMPVCNRGPYFVQHILKQIVQLPSLLPAAQGHSISRLASDHGAQ